MIVVWGAIEALPGKVAEVKALSLEHVQRSRAEPGCISHDVHIDAENPERLVFFEQWQDMAALQAHFAVAESVAFVEAVTALAVRRPAIKIFDAIEVS